MEPEGRLRRLRETRLYFVCDALDGGPRLDWLLEAALAGGVGAIQLRDKDRSDGDLLAAAERFRRAADDHDALFLLNDRPDLAAAAGADGVHVGQHDTAVEAAREAAGEGLLVGLSTHAPAQLEAAERAEGAARPDYVSVGPLWETPTKRGRPAAGIDYLRHAASATSLPFFAIGGIDLGNVSEVVAAGADRIVVVRAIRDAGSPGDAARELLAAVEDGARVTGR